MGKAFQGEAVVYLPRALNNADHGRLLLARLVGSTCRVEAFGRSPKLEERRVGS